MDAARARDRLTGLYVTIPTMFHDDADLSLDLDAIRRHVSFLIAAGCRTGKASILRTRRAAETRSAS